MGRAAALLTVLAALGAVLWFALGRDLPAPPRPETPATGPGAVAPSSQGPAPSSTPAVPATAVPIDPERQPVKFADKLTTFLLVLERGTDQPVPGASVCRYHGGDALEFTDAQGRCALPLAEPEQLAVIADGYLLRLCPGRPGSTAELPQRVFLERDEYSLPCRFRFVRGDGTLAARVHLRLRPQQKPDPANDLPPPRKVLAASAEVKRAWTEHTMIGSLAHFGQLHLQLGERTAANALVLAGEDVVRFANDGLYEFEAATDDGLVAKGVFQASTLVGAPLEVTLQAGTWLDGVVVATGGQPIAGAQIRVVGGDPLALLSTSDDAGRFHIGPFAGGVLTLDVRHGEHEPAQLGPVAPGGGALRVVLQPLAAGTLRGRVRARPSLRPILNATVSVMDPTGKPVTTKTEADGSFTLRTSARETTRLNIAATGFLPYSELLEPGPGRQLDCDLWPSNAGVRLEEKLTGMVRGVVVDEHGRPLAGIAVRLQPDRPYVPEDFGSRRLLDGGSLALPMVAMSGSDGSFELETLAAGSGVVFPVDGHATPAQGTKIDIVLGRTQDGLRLVARPR